MYGHSSHSLNEINLKIYHEWPKFFLSHFSLPASTVTEKCSVSIILIAISKNALKPLHFSGHF